MNTDHLNDTFQQTGDAKTGRAILRACSLTELRALADLNHLDAETGRARLVADLMADRFGAQP